jgi:hypothetical protein
MTKILKNKRLSRVIERLYLALKIIQADFVFEKQVRERI